MAHGVRQVVWGGLRLAVAAEVPGAFEGQPACQRQLPSLTSIFRDGLPTELADRFAFCV